MTRVLTRSGWKADAARQANKALHKRQASAQMEDIAEFCSACISQDLMSFVLKASSRIRGGLVSTKSLASFSRASCLEQVSEVPQEGQSGLEIVRACRDFRGD